MTKLQAIREFGAIVCGKPIVISRTKEEHNNWRIGYEANPTLYLPQTLDFSPDKDDKEFRKNFIERASLTRGFSYITLALLHEFGHWVTRSVYDSHAYHKLEAKTENQEQYMAIPWEMLATQWAICWLSIPENRKVAKRFEGRYFGYA